ncbi:MAG: radical SAM protein [Lachnospiraceae bacterium]|nr:radical SAM protein [Lachnospiraceae bacterium]
MARCEVCFRHCDIREGQLGFCGARTCRDGVVCAANYGRITSLALDPIEKKPLRRFHAGTRILSVGSYGCNLRCPFCQNAEISWSAQAFSYAEEALGTACAGEAASAGQIEQLSAQALANAAGFYKQQGNIGVAFTYNEPLIGYEFVRDTAKLVKEAGMVNVLVTNGTAELSVLEELSPYIDAMNIDLKGFSDSYYSDVLGGNREMVMAFIERAAQLCHIELTTLIIPGENDTEKEMRAISAFIAGLQDADGRIIGEDIPLHISRFFPCFHMTDRPATDVRHIYRLTEVAGEYLRYVYTGNC